MKIIIGEPGSGKTTKLIRLADISVNDGYYIVCPTHMMCYHVRELAMAMDIDIHFPLTPLEATKSTGRGVKALLVDEAPQVLAALLLKQIKAVTITASPQEDSHVT